MVNLPVVLTISVFFFLRPPADLEEVILAEEEEDEEFEERVLLLVLLEVREEEEEIEEEFADWLGMPPLLLVMDLLEEAELEAELEEESGGRSISFLVRLLFFDLVSAEELVVFVSAFPLILLLIFASDVLEPAGQEYQIYHTSKNNKGIHTHTYIYITIQCQFLVWI